MRWPPPWRCGSEGVRVMVKLIPALLIYFPMLTAMVLWVFFRGREKACHAVALAAAAVELVLCALMAALVPAGTAMTVSVGASRLASLEVDGFRKVYCLLVAFMWTMSLALSRDYFRGHHRLGRYYFFTMMTLGATMGVFLAADLLTAFIFFEVMSFTSFPWVIQEETEGAIRAACTYLAVAVIGGLTALMGIFLLYHAYGTTALSALYGAAEAAGDRTMLYVAGGCILFGFGAKAGMFPLHIWLPKAHPVAPAPASALLSGVLTKSGIWGVLALSCYLFRGDAAWGTVILVLGGITMLLGAVLALFSTDLKRTLACSSMSQIGFILTGIGMMVLLGEENALAAHGTLLHMVNHSLFKLILFLSAGAIYMQAHTLDLTALKGFGRKKPFLMACFLIGAAGISGIPGLSGYVSKTLIHEAIVEGIALYGGALRVMEWVFLFSGGLTLAYMTKLFVCIFVEKPAQDATAHSGHAGRPCPLTYVAIGSGAVLIPVMGLAPHAVMDRLAALGTDFFRAGAPGETVSYFSWESLKGGLISIGIGIAVYCLFVLCLMRRHGTYRNLWPAWLDLEDLVYRPLLLKLLPTVFGFFSALFAENRVTGFLYRAALRVGGILARAVHDMMDALVLLISATVLRPAPDMNQDSAVHSLSYRFGSLLDHVLPKRDGREEHHYARLAYRSMRTLGDTPHKLTDTLSFALLMLVMAIVAVLVYVLVIHGRR